MYNRIGMNGQFKNFISVLGALDKKRVEYILVGGIAVMLHGIERFTRDIDIFVKKKDTVRYKDKFDASYLKELIDIRQSGFLGKKNPKKGKR